MTDQKLSSPSDQQFKRYIAYKLRIGDVLAGKPVIIEDKLKCLEFEGKEIMRVNLISNIVDKYIQDGEKKFGSITLDDASGQIRAKVFGDDLVKFENFNQGDTVMVLGLLRQWNNELYITPEIIKKKEPQYLLVRKIELENSKPKQMERGEIKELKDKIIEIIKREEDKGGADVETMILELKSQPDAINAEIKKLLEEGMAYEPRPGKIRYLG